MLGFAPDTWHTHKTPIDYEFIRANYDAVIIGGAGLLHEVFTPCWMELAEKIDIPVIIWGVGGCFLDSDRNSVVDRKVVRKLAERAELINVRDAITAEFYDLKKAHVAPCPTLAWAKTVSARKKPRGVLHAAHTELAPDSAISEISRIVSERQTLRSETLRACRTLSMQRRRREGLRSFRH